MDQPHVETVTSREFVHNVSAAKRTVIEGGTVIVTDRGEPTMAIVPIAEYRRLTKTEKNLVEMLHMPEGDAFDMDFDPIRNRRQGTGRMTTVQEAPEPCFAWIHQHVGPIVTWADAGRRHGVTGDGLEGWWAHFHDDRPHEGLNKNSEQAGCSLSLEIYPSFQPQGNDKPVRWGSTLKVGEGRYVREGGSAASFPEALAQCQAYEHSSRQIGSLTWWLESEDRWTSWLGPFTLKATKIGRVGAESYWHYQVDGDASSLEEAALLASLGRSPAAGASR